MRLDEVLGSLRFSREINSLIKRRQLEVPLDPGTVASELAGALAGFVLGHGGTLDDLIGLVRSGWDELSGVIDQLEGRLDA